MTDATGHLYFRTRAEWRSWLETNHGNDSGAWLVYMKGPKTEQELTYEQSVEEALCFGWIDSLIKRVDDTSYVRKFTPRNSVSKWSESNRRRIAKLEKEGRLAEAGKATVAAASANGSWDKPDRPPKTIEMPPGLKKALAGSTKAKEYFEKLAPSHRERYVVWIAGARKKRLERRGSEKVSPCSKKRRASD
jgi:uncharacterized protein YdeI (YjbR/CyaY-like superfamily)